MKKISFALIILFALISQNIFAEGCREHSDCSTGCAKKDAPYSCLPKQLIKLQGEEKGCALPEMGRACNCENGSCTFVGAELPTLHFKNQECAKEGMEAGGSVTGAARCCAGLTQTNEWTHKNLDAGCNFPPPPGTGGSCVKCGDGKCDKKNFENKCNCPRDCK